MTFIPENTPTYPYFDDDFDDECDPDDDFEVELEEFERGDPEPTEAVWEAYFINQTTYITDSMFVDYYIPMEVEN